MKTKITLLALLFTMMVNAQTSPSFVTTLTDKWIEHSYLDKATNLLYLCYVESGEIKTLDLNNPNLAQKTILSGLSYPTDAAVVGNRLYFTEGANAVDANDMPIPNTGKLSYIDLLQVNPAKITVLSNLNVPFRLAASADFVIIDENTVAPSDPDDFDKQIISKINLTGTVTKTPILTRYWASDNPEDEGFEHFEVVGDFVYANSYQFEGGYFYKYNLQNSTLQNTHFFPTDTPYSFAIYQNYFYYTNGGGSSSNFKTPLSTTNITPITEDFYYNGIGVSFYEWEFDALGNAYVIGEIYGDNNYSIAIFKYTQAQLSTKESSELKNIDIYPNPVFDVLHFSQDLKELKIFDFSGKLILEDNGVISKIDVENLSAGNYVIVGKDVTGNTVSKKFFKK